MKERLGKSTPPEMDAEPEKNKTVNPTDSDFVNQCNEPAVIDFLCTDPATLSEEKQKARQALITQLGTLFNRYLADFSTRQLSPTERQFYDTLQKILYRIQDASDTRFQSKR